MDRPMLLVPTRLELDATTRPEVGTDLNSFSKFVRLFLNLST